jgi:hypothetical protein
VNLFSIRPDGEDLAVKLCCEDGVPSGAGRLCGGAVFWQGRGAVRIRVGAIGREPGTDYRGCQRVTARLLAFLALDSEILS